METGLKPFYFASFLVTGIFSFFFRSLQTSLNCETATMNQNALGPLTKKTKEPRPGYFGARHLLLPVYRRHQFCCCRCFFFFLFLCSRLVVTRWRSRFGIALKTNFFPIRSPYCESLFRAYSHLSPTIIQHSQN